MNVPPPPTLQAAIAELRVLLSQFDPLEILSRVALYIITGHGDESKEQGPHHNETHLEYLISFVTAHPYPSAPEFPPPGVIQQVIHLLTDIHVGASIEHMLQRRAANKDRNDLEALADAFRMEKLHIRGDAYWPHLRQTQLDLLGPHDWKLTEMLGFSSADFFRFIERVEDEVSARLEVEMKTSVAPYRRLLGPWLHEIDSGPNEAGEWSSELIEFLDRNGREIAEAKERFDRFGSPGSFIANATAPAEERILDTLGISFGDNLLFYGDRTEQAFSPLNKSVADSRPILRHEGICYAFHIPKLLRGAYGILSGLLKERDFTYWQDRFLKFRDRYLERETAALFAKALPHATIVIGATYNLAATGENTEADIVVVCDSFLLVVECKAGHITPGSRRGGIRRTKTDLTKTIADGLNQAERLVRELATSGSLEIRPRDGSTPVVLTAIEYRWLVRVNVTLELISSAAVRLWKLADAGWIETSERCWSLNLNDLRVIVEILNQPAIFLHYVLRRLDINVIGKVEARDELDYLMHYVVQGLFFRGENLPGPDQRILIANYTEELDQYYRRVEGLTARGKKPTPRLGKGTPKILGLLETHRPLNWITASVELLEIDPNAQEQLTGKIPGLLAKLRDPRGAYSFTVMATSDGNGLALAFSNDPARSLQPIQARLRSHCRDHGLRELWVLLFGVPMSASAPHVFMVTPEDTVAESTERLLSQMSYEITNHSQPRTHYLPSENP